MTTLAAVVDRLLWPTYAHLYDSLLDVHAYRDMLAEVARAVDGRDCVVLDGGAGTGNVACELLRDGAGHVLLVDSSGTMLRKAAAKLRPEVLEDRVRIVQGDLVATMESLPPASVDRIALVNVLYALPSRPAFFRSARRLLRPGGYIVVSHTTRPGSGPIVRDQVRRGGRRSLTRPRLLGLIAVDLVIDLVARSGRYDFAPIVTVSEEASAAGLGPAESLGRTYGGPVEGVNELLRIPVASDLRDEIGVATGVSARSALPGGAA